MPFSHNTVNLTVPMAKKNTTACAVQFSVTPDGIASTCVGRGAQKALTQKIFFASSLQFLVLLYCTWF